MGALDGYSVTPWGYVKSSADIYATPGVVDGGTLVPGASLTPVTIGNTYATAADFEAAFYGANTGPTGATTTYYGGTPLSPSPPVDQSVDWSTIWSVGDLDAQFQALIGFGFTLIQALEFFDSTTRANYPAQCAGLPGYAFAVPYQATVVDYPTDQPAPFYSFSGAGWAGTAITQDDSITNPSWASYSMFLVISLVAGAPPPSAELNVSQTASLVVYQNSPISGGLGADPTGTPIDDPVGAYTFGRSRSRAWSFTLDGHTFYVMDMGYQGTFLWDQVTNQWARWETYGFGKWNVVNGTQWGVRIVGGDLLTDQVWEYDPSAVLDDWRDINHVSTGGFSTRSRTFIGCDAVRVSASFGLLDEVNGCTMSLRFSDDQEATWSPYFTVTLGEGDFDQEIAYRSLGSFNAPGRIFELSDVGGLLRIDGADAFLNGFDNDQQSQEAEQNNG